MLASCLGPDGIHLAAHLLEQEVELSPHGSAGGEEGAQLLRVHVQTRELFGHVGAVGEHEQLLLEPNLVHRQLQVLLPAFRARLQAPPVTFAHLRLPLAHVRHEGGDGAEALGQIVRERGTLTVAHAIERDDRGQERGARGLPERLRAATVGGNEEIGHDREQRERDLGVRRELVAQLGEGAVGGAGTRRCPRPAA